MIEELFLPDSSREIELACHPLACPLLPCPHKDRQFLRIQFGPAKEMNMIGHDHIAANCPTVTIVRIQPFIGQNSRSFVGSEDWSAFKSARCDEIGRPIDPNAFEPAQCLRIFIVVAGIGDPGRAFGSGINDAGYSMLPSPLGATPTVKIYAPLGEYFPKNQGLAPIYKTRRA